MDRRTIEAYDAYHEVYDAETKDFWECFPDDIMNSFLKRLKGKKVLDLGSGPGRDAVLLRKHGLEVHCVDGSQNMVNMTEKLGFESLKCDFRNISLPESSYDGIWAYSSLFHVNFNEAAQIMRKSHGLLKPDGLMLLGLIEGTGNEEVSLSGSRYTRFFEYYNESKIRSLLEKTEFNLLEIHKYRPGNQTYLNLILQK